MDYSCPYCSKPTTITNPNFEAHWEEIDIDAERLGTKAPLGLYYKAIACPNPDCRKMSLMVRLTNSKRDARYNPIQAETIRQWQLLPDSYAKPQPDYIPVQIVNDYVEACRIIDLSPKAAATLARRCLQGMIRDYWDVSKGRLADEIMALEEKVTPEVWDSIDAVRSVGNIGAHMEKNVNIMVDIDPGEAELLINLIEDLFSDWYVTRHNRQERQQKIKALAAAKNSVKKTGEATKVDTP